MSVHSKDIVFEEAVGEVVHHFFPNGSPLLTPGDLANTDAAPTWRQPKSREHKSVTDALKSMKCLQRIAIETGLTSSQQHAIILAACASLSPVKASRMVSKDEKISGSFFIDLLRVNLPRAGHSISAFSVLKLLSVCQDVTGTTKPTSLRIIHVLRFLTLAVEHRALTEQGLRKLSSMYALIFSWSTDPVFCADATRLLLAITRRKHVRMYRMQRICQCYRSSIGSEPDSRFSPFFQLLQLYAKISPECDKVFTSMVITSKGKDLKRNAGWLAFPDPSWKRDFYRVWYKNNDAPILSGGKLGSSTNEFPFQNNGTESIIHHDNTPDILSLGCLQLYPEMGADSKAPLSQDIARVRVCLSFILQQEWHHHHGLTHGTSIGRNMGGSIRAPSSLQTDVKGSESMETGMDNEDVHDTNHPSPCFQARNDSKSVLANARLRILEGLTSGFIQSDHSREAEMAFSRDILPYWDGTEEWGVSLCYDILQAVATPITFSELWSKALVFIEKLFLNGTPKIKYAIVSGTIASLLSNLTRCCKMADMVEIDAKNSTQGAGQDAESTSRPVNGSALAVRRVIKEFIHWVQQLFLESSLLGPSWESGLLSEAATDFFQVVGCQVTRRCNLLVLPGASWVYRMLLSSSPFATDRGWQLMVAYVKSLKELKARNDEKTSSPRSTMVVEGFDRVAIFNCMVWDFCLIVHSKPPTQGQVMSIVLQDIPGATLARLGGQNALCKDAPPMLSVSEGAAFSQYSADFLQSVSTKQSTKQIRGKKAKQEYFNFLQGAGMYGLQIFREQFIRTLSE